MDSNKRYIIGSPKKLAELFPNYNGNDIRVSFDEKLAIYEVNLTNDELKKMKADKGVKVFTHDEIITEINSPKSAGIWYVTSGYSSVVETPENSGGQG